jgi:hypothetical protein
MERRLKKLVALWGRTPYVEIPSRMSNYVRNTILLLLAAEWGALR